MDHFNFIRTSLDGVMLIQPKIYSDDRGCFFESYQKEYYAKNGIVRDFVQENFSRSAKGTLRGIGFQKQHTQGKLIQVMSGSIFDVAVDVRPSSVNFGRHFSTVLSSKNRTMIWIPEGFAHGFLSLEESSEILFKCTDVYDPESEGGIMWNDPILSINWPSDGYNFIINDRDKNYSSFNSQDFSWANRFMS